MSTASSGIVEQAQRLAAAARLLPADEAVRVLEQVSIIAQAAQAQLLAAAERSGELRDSGCRTARSYAATVLRRSPEDAGQVAKVALHLVCFPRLAEAYCAGLVHTANLRAILTHLGACGLAVLQSYEEALLLLATRAGPAEIHTFCRELAAVHHPQRERDQVLAQGARLVRIHRLGDLAHVDAMIDPVIADQVKATLTAMAAATRSPGDPRGHAERVADALEQLLCHGMSHRDHHDGAAAHGRARPHASVSVQLETLLGMGTAGPAVLARFGVIPRSTAARMACDAVVRLVVKHGERVLNVGRARRVVSARQRAALAHTYKSCVVPGCGVRFADCDIHHLWWWSLAGPTDLDLQLPLCASHHIWLHEGGYSITLHDGVLQFRDPRGRLITNRQHLLHHQLHLLPPQHTGTGDAPAPAERLLQDLDGRPDTRYRRGRWGWTGHDPAPPPGHAPPRSA